MKAGVGYCNTQDSFTSGKEAGEIALKKGSINRADFVFSFCSGNTDYDEFFRGLQSVLGNEVPIIGGAAIGIIYH